MYFIYKFLFFVLSFIFCKYTNCIYQTIDLTNLNFYYIHCEMEDLYGNISIVTVVPNDSVKIIKVKYKVNILWTNILPGEYLNEVKLYKLYGEPKLALVVSDFYGTKYVRFFVRQGFIWGEIRLNEFNESFETLIRTRVFYLKNVVDTDTFMVQRQVFAGFPAYIFTPYNVYDVVAAIHNNWVIWSSNRVNKRCVRIVVHGKLNDPKLVQITVLRNTNIPGFKTDVQGGKLTQQKDIMRMHLINEFLRGARLARKRISRRRKLGTQSTEDCGDSPTKKVSYYVPKRKLVMPKQYVKRPKKDQQEQDETDEEDILEDEDEDEEDEDGIEQMKQQKKMYLNEKKLLENEITKLKFEVNQIQELIVAERDQSIDKAGTEEDSSDDDENDQAEEREDGEQDDAPIDLQDGKCDDISDKKRERRRKLKKLYGQIRRKRMRLSEAEEKLISLKEKYIEGDGILDCVIPKEQIERMQELINSIKRARQNLAQLRYIYTVGKKSEGDGSKDYQKKCENLIRKEQANLEELEKEIFILECTMREKIGFNLELYYSLLEGPLKVGSNVYHNIKAGPHKKKRYEPIKVKQIQLSELTQRIEEEESTEEPESMDEQQNIPEPPIVEQYITEPQYIPEHQLIVEQPVPEPQEQQTIQEHQSMSEPQPITEPQVTYKPYKPRIQGSQGMRKQSQTQDQGTSETQDQVTSETQDQGTSETQTQVTSETQDQGTSEQDGVVNQPRLFRPYLDEPYQPQQQQPQQVQHIQQPYDPYQHPYQHIPGPFQPYQEPYQPYQESFQPYQQPYDPYHQPYDPYQQPYQPVPYEPYQPIPGTQYIELQPIQQQYYPGPQYVELQPIQQQIPQPVPEPVPQIQQQQPLKQPVPGPQQQQPVLEPEVVTVSISDDSDEDVEQETQTQPGQPQYQPPPYQPNQPPQPAKYQPPQQPVSGPQQPYQPPQYPGQPQPFQPHVISQEGITYPQQPFQPIPGYLQELLARKATQNQNEPPKRKRGRPPKIRRTPEVHENTKKDKYTQTYGSIYTFPVPAQPLIPPYPSVEKEKNQDGGEEREPPKQPTGTNGKIQRSKGEWIEQKYYKKVNNEWQLVGKTEFYILLQKYEMEEE
ncbi:putative P-,Q-rich family protein, putative [Theileria annulata]|uniref:Hypothetical P-,Q-rich family protein, putative n=1 Tax=Theileria annulata TaxID=5874 RepID=Q4UDS2_THEAN|nr:putative P-,Q-rich family protein, putative [Theileria annulata]CAI74767.1 hypothetical P-,Q-rich family protein, putative [Theileria annulata]|eukprot:XP_952499.1 hypothetical P-,Q-rich family protein, putative [Theileria annulata]